MLLSSKRDELDNIKGNILQLEGLEAEILEQVSPGNQSINK
jgi:hypothetical protein